MGTPTIEAAEAERFLQETEALLQSINSGAWAPPGLATGGGLTALDQTMRPIDELTNAGLGWLVPHVQPLQGVLDRMAGSAGVVQTWADTSKRASEKIDEIRDQLAARAQAETDGWNGLAGARYRRRAQELTLALEGTARTVLAASIMAKQMGELIADARRQVNELLTDLVQRLISYARQAVAAEGGVTPNVVAQCTQMINSYSGPIAELERKLEQALDSVRPPVLPGPELPSTTQIVAESIAKAIEAVANAFGRGKQIFARRGPGIGGPPRRPTQVTERQMVDAILNSPKTKIGQVRPPSRWPPDTGVGKDMHQQIDSVVRQRWPDVHFAPQQRVGPDMPVQPRPGQNSSSRPPFDWVEIKPHTPDGIKKFVETQWGQNAAWTGRGRLVTYDQHGNIYEIDFPARTGPMPR
jgi:uncharacterized protein YukE